jgi:hypothetical protein
MQEKAYPLVRPWYDLKLFAWIATRDLKPRYFRYASHARTAKRAVFEVYEREWQGKIYTHYRHMAFHGQFRLHEGAYFLEITPTYLYTHDGKRVHRRHSEWLTGIKRLDRNRAVLAQLFVWTQYLQQQHEGDLFSPPYPFLSFGRLKEFTLDVGIDDAGWQQSDETATDASGDEDDEPPPLEATTP